MVEKYAFYKDKEEVTKAELGVKHIKQYLKNTESKKAFAVASNKNLYIKGVDDEKVIDLNSIIGIDYTASCKIWMLILGLSFLSAYPIYSLLVSVISSNLSLFFNLLLDIFLKTIPFFILSLYLVLAYYLNRQVCLTVYLEPHYDTVRMNLMGISKKEVHRFQVAMRESMKDVKEIKIANVTKQNLYTYGTVSVKPIV